MFGFGPSSGELFDAVGGLPCSSVLAHGVGAAASRVEVAGIVQHSAHFFCEVRFIDVLASAFERHDDLAGAGAAQRQPPGDDQVYPCCRDKVKLRAISVADDADFL